MDSTSKEIIMSRERKTAFSPIFGMPYGKPTKVEEAQFYLGHILADEYETPRSDSVHEEFLALLEKI
jgi:hypothetical protein